MRRFAVIGLGRFGRTLACELAVQGAEVIALDCDGDRVEEVKEKVTVAVKLDARDEEALTQAGVTGVETAVVAIGNSFEAVQLTMIALKSIGVPTVISRSTGPIQEKILWRLGADVVINPEKEGALRLTSKLMRPHLLDDLGPNSEVDIVQIRVPKSLSGLTVVEASMRSKFGVNIVALGIPKPQPPTEDVDEDAPPAPTFEFKVPDPEDTLSPDITLVLFGKRKALDKLVEKNA